MPCIGKSNVRLLWFLTECDSAHPMCVTFLPALINKGYFTLTTEQWHKLLNWHRRLNRYIHLPNNQYPSFSHPLSSQTTTLSKSGIAYRRVICRHRRKSVEGRGGLGSASPKNANKSSAYTGRIRNVWNISSDWLKVSCSNCRMMSGKQSRQISRTIFKIPQIERNPLEDFAARRSATKGMRFTIVSSFRNIWAFQFFLFRTVCPPLCAMRCNSFIIQHLSFQFVSLRLWDDVYC